MHHALFITNCNQTKSIDISRNIMNFIVLLEAQYAMKYVTVIILKIMYKLLYKWDDVHDSKTYTIRRDILSDVKTYAT